MQTRTRPTDRLASAIVDGTAIDWNWLESRSFADPERRMVTELGTLARLAERGRDHRAGCAGVGGRTRLGGIAATLGLIAALRISLGLMCLAVLIVETAGWPSAIFVPNALVTIGFFVAGAVLLRANRADRRAAELGLVFLIVATSFANGLYGHLPDALHVRIGLNALPVDCFLGYAFWRFVREFPSAAGYREVRWLNAAAGLACCSGIVLLAANAACVVPSLASHAQWLRSLQRRSAKGTVYWAVVFAAFLPAVPLLAYRTYRAGEEARRRGWLFLAGLTLGLFPLSLLIVLETASARFMRFSLAHRNAGVYTALAFLMTIPLTTAYAVLVSRVLSVRVLIRRTLRYTLARSTLQALSAMPFGFLVWRVYVDRNLPVAVVFGSVHVRALFAVALTGGVLLAYRTRLQALLDRAFSRVSYDVAASIAALLDEAHRSTTLSELAAGALDRVVGTLELQSGAILVHDMDGQFPAIAGRIAPLAGDSAIALLAAASTAPFYVDLHVQPGALARLPQDDLFWLVDNDVRAVVPMHGAADRLIGLLVLGPAKSDEPLEAAHGPLLAGLGPALAGPVAQRLGTASVCVPSTTAAESSRALECDRCGCVTSAGTEGCPECRGPLLPSVVPLVVGSKFRVERRIGSGGMGVVYRANDIALGRDVAIKTLPKVSFEQGVRLRREGRTMATLSHANLATVFGIETWRGTPILVVEYLAGGTLADRLGRGPMPLSACVDILLGVLAGLDHAHERGIFHRDLKPSNIGFTAQGHPKILDFGLATVAEELAAPVVPLDDLSLDESAVLTDRRVGTLPYMAPEAIRGATPTAAFDLWSAAMVMAEMLTGFAPVAARQAITRGADAASVVLRRALEPEPSLRPSLREFRQLVVQLREVG